MREKCDLMCTVCAKKRSASPTGEAQGKKGEGRGGDLSRPLQNCGGRGNNVGGTLYTVDNGRLIGSHESEFISLIAGEI